MKRDSPKDRTLFNPPVSVTDDGRFIHVSIHLPGVAEEQIRIDLERTMCTVSILVKERTLKKAIRIPPGARVFQKKFSDEVLKITLEKPAPDPGL